MGGLFHFFVVFDLGDFVDALLVAATGVGGGQEGLHHFDGLGAGDDAAAKGQHVGVIVFAGEAGGEHVMGEASTDSGDFIGGDGNANAAAADDDAEIVLLRGHALADGFAKVGVVHGFFRGGALIIDEVSGILQELADGFLDGEAGVVRAERNTGFGGSVGHGINGGIVAEGEAERNARRKLAMGQFWIFRTNRELTQVIPADSKVSCSVSSC